MKMRGTKLMSVLECMHVECFPTNVKFYGYYLFNFRVYTRVYVFLRLAQLHNRTLGSLLQRLKQTAKKYRWMHEEKRSKEEHE
jgi:hypothetical protein